MKYLTLFTLFIISFFAQAQEEDNRDIVTIIDELTIKWDKQAEKLGKFSGMKYYCTAEQYRDNTIQLLDKIHHYDTLLYGIVSEKYANSKDKEAKATLEEILTVETDYTTPNFKDFLQIECDRFAEIEETYSRNDSNYYKEIEKLEKELGKYVGKITTRIDLIDEHIHHLQLN